MDQVSQDRTRGGAHRRERMREEARTQRTVRYQTPQWLERSFVLPVRGPDVPQQNVPRHDDGPTHRADLPLVPPAPATQSHRPPAVEIDFARVVERSDLSRRASHVGWTTAGLTLVTLVVCLVLPSAAMLATVVGFAALCLVALTASIQLSHAPVPRVERKH